MHIYIYIMCALNYGNDAWPYSALCRHDFRRFVFCRDWEWVRRQHLPGMYFFVPHSIAPQMKSGSNKCLAMAGNGWNLGLKDPKHVPSVPAPLSQFCLRSGALLPPHDYMSSFKSGVDRSSAA